MVINNKSSLSENPSSNKKRKVEITPPRGADNNNKELAEEDDPFERLGDEVIVEILVRVNDEKSLRRCLAVNKRMSCLVKLADPVYIRIHPDPWSADIVDMVVLHNNVKFDAGVCLSPEKFSCNTCISHLPKSNPPPSLDHIISYYINTASEYLRRNVPVVGKPIHHVTVILPPTEDTVFGYNHEWAWNLEYSGGSNGGGLIKSCCALFADFSSKLRADNIFIDCQTQLITRCMRLGVILRPMVEWMVREYDTLCRVTIVTECGYARLHIGPEEILKMKKKSKSKNNIISNNGSTSLTLFKMKLDMKMFYYGTTFFIVTDPETHHNTQDVKTLIRDLLDRRPHLHYNDNIAKNINKMRTRVIKHKNTLPPCILQIPNSNWEWNCEI